MMDRARCHRSGAYRLYHAGSSPKVTGKVVPNHHGKVLNFSLQIKRGAGWRALAKASFRIRANGTAIAYLVNLHSGSAYRLSTVFFGDADHRGDSSPWQCLR